jgi:hypothetical protein
VVRKKRTSGIVCIFKGTNPANGPYCDLPLGLRALWWLFAYLEEAARFRGAVARSAGYAIPRCLFARIGSARHDAGYLRIFLRWDSSDSMFHRRLRYSPIYTLSNALFFHYFRWNGIRADYGTCGDNVSFDYYW